MDKFEISSADHSEFTREDLERLQKVYSVLCEHVSKASLVFDELYLYLKSIYEPSDDN